MTPSSPIRRRWKLEIASHEVSSNRVISVANIKAQQGRK
jgi:hypothetical protein